MKTPATLLFALALICWIAGCDQAATETGDTHTHEDGSVHADDHGGAPADDDQPDEPAHAHDEVDLGSVTIGGLEVELAQGHGAVSAGKECHLVVKLPYSDKGDTVVRAWLGTADRAIAHVGKGDYAASHDDYDVHAIAPDPLAPDTMWWIEIEKPDGTTVVGSARPILE